jgi:hypothetical protein
LYIPVPSIINKYLKNPKEFKSWSKFTGPKYPAEWGLDFEITNSLSLVATEFLLLILTFAQIVVIIDLIQIAIELNFA